MSSPFFAHRAMCGQGRIDRKWKAVRTENSGVVFGKNRDLKIEIVLAKFEIVPSLEMVLDSSGPFQKPAFRHFAQNLFSPASESERPPWHAVKMLPWAALAKLNPDPHTFKSVGWRWPRFHGKFYPGSQTSLDHQQADQISAAWSMLYTCDNSAQEKY